MFWSLALLMVLGCDRGPQGLENFVRTDPHGERLSLHGFADKRAVVLISHGSECPVIQQYMPTIHGLATEYAAQGVQFAFVSANPQDTAAEIAADLSAFGATLPTFVDGSQAMSRSLDFRTTAETVVIDPKTWTIVYRGAVDDQISYAGRLDAPRNHFLKAALNEFLAGKKISKPYTPAFGCTVTYRDP
jgi:thiol-disulfide isomerase/thioredoxin